MALCSKEDLVSVFGSQGPPSKEGRAPSTFCIVMSRMGTPTPAKGEDAHYLLNLGASKVYTELHRLNYMATLRYRCTLAVEN